MKSFIIITAVLLFNLSALCQEEFPVLSETRREKINLNKLNDLNLISKIRLDSTGFFLDTVYFENPSNSVFLKTTNQYTSITKVDNITYNWEASGIVVFRVIGVDLASEYVSLKGIIKLNYENRGKYVISNEVRELSSNETFIYVQYFWISHLILTLISMVVLFINNSKLTIRHIVMFLIPNIGPLFFLIRKLYLLFHVNFQKLDRSSD